MPETEIKVASLKMGGAGVGVGVSALILNEWVAIATLIYVILQAGLLIPKYIEISRSGEIRMFRTFKKPALTVMATLIVFVGGWEGYRNTAYLDTGGVPTICYGETKHVYIGQTESKAECDRMLEDRLGEFLMYVDNKVVVSIPDTRRAALASFTYNVGKGAFRRSTLLKKLNSGDTIGACNELPRWIYDNGKKLRGLVRRRAAEREMCLIGAT